MTHKPASRPVIPGHAMRSQLAYMDLRGIMPCNA